MLYLKKIFFLKNYIVYKVVLVVVLSNVRMDDFSKLYNRAFTRVFNFNFLDCETFKKESQNL